jgi:Tol biopolymer transport system component
VKITKIVNSKRFVRWLGWTLFAAVPAGVHAAEESLPLATDRVIEMTVDEATWLSVDVHPDGRELAIEVLGDLYRLPIGGGAAEPLSTGAAFDSQPVYSPDGGHLAFVSDRDGEDAVWLLDLAASEFTKLSGSDDRGDFTSPSWAPDGTHVLVSKGSWGQGTYELWAYHVHGGKGVRITKAKPKSDTPRNRRHSALGAVYSPDGRYVYFARKFGGFGYNVRFPQWQIVRRDVTTGAEDQLTQASGSAFKPMLSPDGRLLVYGTRYEQETGLRVRNLDTGEDDWLVYPVQRDDQESRFTRDVLPRYAFTPTGDALLTTRGGKLIRVAMPTGEVSEIPFSVSIRQPVAERLEFPYRTGLSPAKARVLADGVLSPDGRKLAFSAFMRIYVYDFDKNATVPISPEGMVAGFPSWSPKGNELVYADWSAQGGHIYRQRATGRGSPRRLTTSPSYYLYPAWSPDGERIVALRGSTHERLARESGTGAVVGSDVVWLSARGGEANLVLPSRGLSRPHFGPDPERIYLHASGGSGGLVSIRYDGSDRRNILSVKGPGIYGAEEDVPAEFMQLSPDGLHALVRHANQVYVAALVNPNLANQEISLKNPANPVRQITDVGADFVGWSPNGEELVWTVGNFVYRRPLSSVEFRESNGEDGNGGNAKRKGETDSEIREKHEAVAARQVEIYLPRDRPDGVVALTNATWLTMESDGVIEDGVAVVSGDRIVAIGAADAIEIPADVTTIDLDGAFVVPGFIDTHAHFRVSRDIPMTHSWGFLANLAYGVTTGMDVQPSTVDVLIAEDLVQAGLMLGPRAFSTGPGVFSNNAFRSLAHARAVLTRYRDHYGVRNIKAYIAGSRKQRQWIVSAARELKLMPTTEGALDMKLNLTHMIDGFSGNEHNFPLPDLYADVVGLAARTRIAYTPTLLVSYGGPWGENRFYVDENPHDDEKLRRFTPYPFLASRTLRRSWFHEREYVTDRVAEQARKIVDAGGQVGVGAHGQLQGLGYHWELWSLAKGGFAPLEALRAATLSGAQMLGIAQDLGSLTEGKLADLVVLDADPREDIRHTTAIRYVMKGGRLYEADTLNEIWPRQRTLEPLWWHDQEPSTPTSQRAP